MHRHSESPRPREITVFCLAAIADVVDRLPALYRVVEVGEDDVRIELRMKAGAWEVLRFAAVGPDNIAGSLSTHLDSPRSAPFPEWFTDAADALGSDLHWAASRSCTDQGDEILSALIKFRGSVLRGAIY